MKRCPTCKREFEDSITYCLDDGTPVVNVTPAESDPTLVNPPPGGSEIPPTQYGELGGKATVAGSVADLPGMPAYHQPPSPKRAVWPWIVAGLAILFLLIILIAAVIAIPKIINSSRNTNRVV